MSFLEPVWLLLAVPAGWAVWRWPPTGRLGRGLRWALVGLLALAMARPAIRWPAKDALVVVAVDRSASMPSGSLAEASELIARLESTAEDGDRLGVVSFAERAAVETPPGPPGAFSGFDAEVGSERSELGAALDLALGSLPAETAGRILVVSDGRASGGELEAAVARAALADVALDYRLLERSTAGDLAIGQVEAPAEVSPGEGYLLSAWVYSPVGQDAGYRLERNGEALAAGSRRLAAGWNRLSFRDRASGAGTRGYRLQVTRGVSEGAVSEGASRVSDPVPENNSARWLTTVRGPRPLVVVGEGALAELLRAAGLDVRAARPVELGAVGGVELSLAELAGVSAVVLENVGAQELGTPVLENLAAWVAGAGGGLFMTGGRSSFGVGGYYKSPLERVLPVSMELRREHRKFDLAMVVALDRSGSMAAPAGGGRTKMDLANLAAIEVLDLLAPTDEFGAVAVDSASHVVVPLTPVAEAGRAKPRLARIESMGGGIFVYEALVAAARELTRSDAGARHVLLFADAADAEEPGEYRRLLEECRRSGVTVSVVGLGTAADADAALLREIAALGQGRIFFARDAAELPRLFAQDTFVAARSAFIEESVAWRPTANLSALMGRSLGEPPGVGGYNLTYLQSGAQLGAASEDERGAPLVGWWQAGLGRAVAYTGEVAGEFTGAVGDWPEFGEMLVSLGRWAAGEDEGLGPGVVVTQDVEGGRLRVVMHLDPERLEDPFARPPRVRFLRGVLGEKPREETEALRWLGPDRLGVEKSLDGEEVVLATVEIEGRGVRKLAPIRLAARPELMPVASGEGRQRLESWARATGGRERVEVGGFWDDFPRAPRRHEITPWLLVAAILAFLFEILERRTGWPRRGSAAWRLEIGRGGRRREKPMRARPATSEKTKPERAREQGEIAAAEEGRSRDRREPGVLGALERARRKAGQRTRDRHLE